MSGEKHKMNELDIPAGKKMRSDDQVMDESYWHIKIFTNIEEFPNIIIYKIILFLNCIDRICLLRTNIFWNKRIGEFGIKVDKKLLFVTWDTSLSIFSRKIEKSGNNLMLSIHNMNTNSNIVLIPKLSLNNISLEFKMFNIQFCLKLLSFLDEHSEQYEQIELHNLKSKHFDFILKKCINKLFDSLLRKCERNIFICLWYSDIWDGSMSQLINHSEQINCKFCCINDHFWINLPPNVKLLRLDNCTIDTRNVLNIKCSIEMLDIVGDSEHVDIYKKLIKNTTSKLLLNCCDRMIMKCLPECMNRYTYVRLPFNVVNFFLVKYKHPLHELCVILDKHHTIYEYEKLKKKIIPHQVNKISCYWSSPIV